MSGEDDVIMVNNNYKSALETARATCRDPAAELADALTAAKQAMADGAWTGPMGEDFAGELDSWKTKLNDAGPAAISALDTAIAAQPDRVPSTAWQVRWQNMGPR